MLGAGGCVRLALVVALLFQLSLVSSFGLRALVANAAVATAAVVVFFDVAILGCFVLAILVAIASAAVGAAVLLGIWGDIRRSGRRMLLLAAKASAVTSPLVGVWAYTMVQLDAVSTFWACGLCSFALGCSAVVALAGQVFTLLIVRLLILPACLPPKVFGFLSGCPEGHLDHLRDRLATKRAWEPFAVSCGALSIDAMTWRGGSQAARRGKSADGGPERWAIAFLGNGARYEECGVDLEGFANDLGVSVCVFNYRGVGRSTGVPWRFGDLVADGSAVLDALCAARSVDPSSVILYGHSMGGAVATHVRLQSPGGILVNDRSFSALSNVPVAWVHQLAGAYEEMVPKMLIEPVCDTVVALMGTMGWAASVHADWSEHAAVATRVGSSTGPTLVLYSADDEIIPYKWASFHSAATTAWQADGLKVKELAEGEGQTMAGCKEGEQIRCMRLSIYPAAPNDHGNQQQPSSPHNEWVCAVPEWKKVADWVTTNYE